MSLVRLVALAPFALALLVSALAPPPAEAQLLQVRSSDTVLLARTYLRRGDGSTQPTARFGMVLEKESNVRRLEIDAPGAPAHAVVITARRKDEGARVDWQLLGGGSAQVQSSGSTTVDRRASAHVELGTAGDAEVFASLEAGRGSDFDLGRIQVYFQPGAAAPAAAVPATAPVSPGWVQPPLAAPPAPATLDARAIDLAFRVEADGQTLAAPRVRVSNGEEFTVEIGSGVRLVDGALHEGLELTGTPRHEGSTTWLDLSVQSGRRLDTDGPATYVVDRFRQGLRLPDGQQVVLELFGDVPGASAGALRLLVTATPQ